MTISSAPSSIRVSKFPSRTVQLSPASISELPQNNTQQLSPMLLARPSSIPVHAEPSSRLFASRLPLQRKLAAGSVSDPLEAEADAMAERVVRGVALGAPSDNSRTPALRRKCTCGGSCDKCKEGQKGTLQRKASDTVTPTEAPPVVHEVLRTPGQPLDGETRSFMESRFGYDFSRVRIHADSMAARSAGDIQARAYTVGRDVVFAEGQFVPSTAQGKTLLAHELTHVAQQNGVTPMIQRAPAKEKGFQNEVNFAQYRGRVMAARIRKHTKLSKEAREKINRELEYFDGAAKDAYLKLVKPALIAVNEIEMPDDYLNAKPTKPIAALSDDPQQREQEKRNARDKASSHSAIVPNSSTLDNSTLKPEYDNGWVYKSMPGYVFFQFEPGTYAYNLSTQPSKIHPVDHAVAAIILKNGHPIFDRNADAIYELPQNLLSPDPGELSGAGIRWHAKGPRQFYRNPKALDLAMEGFTKEAEIWEAGHGCASCHIERLTNGPVPDAQLDLDHYIRVSLAMKMASDVVSTVLPYDPRNPFTLVGLAGAHGPGPGEFPVGNEVPVEPPVSTPPEPLPVEPTVGGPAPTPAVEPHQTQPHEAAPPRNPDTPAPASPKSLENPTPASPAPPKPKKAAGPGPKPGEGEKGGTISDRDSAGPPDRKTVSDKKSGGGKRKGAGKGAAKKKEGSKHKPGTGYSHGETDENLDPLEQEYGEDPQYEKQKDQRISDAHKSELEDSGWLKERLTDPDDRRDFMKWLEKRHGVGEAHNHFPPGAPRTAKALKQWKEEEAPHLLTNEEREQGPETTSLDPDDDPTKSD